MAELLRSALRLHLHDFKRHLRLPFVVPDETAALRVTLTFGPPGVGEIANMINFSLFSPDGFRGAGHRHGSRHEALIGNDGATPGFVPGPLTPGDWEVVIHTHMVASMVGGEVVVETLEAGPDAAMLTEPLESPATVPGAWMMGDLHCHSDHSDARWTVRELAEAATARGLNFLALTDHNTTSGRAELSRLAPKLLQLPGLELTTFYGHATVLGIDGYLDWTPLDALHGPRELSQQVAADGGLFTIAHPFSDGDPVCTGCAWTYFDLRPAGASHLEVWNGAWNQPQNVQALEHWYGLLAAGLRVIATAGSDVHGPEYLPGDGLTCTPTTQDTRTLLSQLRAGNTYLARAACLDMEIQTPGGAAMLGSVQPAGRWTVDLKWQSLPSGSELRLMVDGERRIEPLSEAGSQTFELDVERWFNLELRLPDGELYALTNPVWATPPRLEPADLRLTSIR
ncbi:CehA/McbA family metallohydrolase [Deinococcus sp.]|uniref:CehA/McbA family metallohydrolase n=1 Tax=Deinococcus sp. TaxID=47478 RepID=UPI003B59D069